MFEAIDHSEVLLILAAAAVAAAIVIGAAWIATYGPLRGALATVCRLAWLSPLVVSFFPETRTEQLPRALTLKPLHLLIDDTKSMEKTDGRAQVPSLVAQRIVAEFESQCARIGCLPKVTHLSELAPETRDGFTPLARGLDAWLYKVGADPWLLVTDGADERPGEKWPASFRGLGRPQAAGRAPRGLIVGFAPKDVANIWIQDLDVAPFSFEDKPLIFDVSLRRSTKAPTPERIQVQVSSGDAALATANTEFPSGEDHATVTITVPPLPRGQRLLTVRALPTADERALWDNAVSTQVEVMPNTVGVLHLLGSPSWDGRFLRRYLKSEPKYDLISFFILRDPWDSQQVNERELSLIPFPVERLFREELPNFRVVVIQNFKLFQFLLPEYQNNLVKFVQEGGGLLFVGGPRALTTADLSSSPLRSILPFQVNGREAGALGGDFGLDDEFDEVSGDGQKPATTGPAYDPTTEFKVELARPEAAKRALANVYDDWEALGGELAGWNGAKGLHHMERVQFKSDVTTTLLNAVVGEQRVPLAVASYPGRGRAIWLFTDTLWRLALTPSEQTSRQVYNHFLQASMTWLLRQDLRQPLVAKGLSLAGGGTDHGTFRVTLQGPAARYFQPSPDWKVTACGAVVPPDALVAARRGDTEWDLAGPLAVALAGGQRCTLEVEGTHAAFGSVKTAITAIAPDLYKDDELDAAPQKLEELAELTGARLVLPPADGLEAAGQWLFEVTGQEGVALPDRVKTLRDFYWVLHRWWFLALLAFMPLEVIVRRWEQLSGGRSGQLVGSRRSVSQ